MSKMPISTAQLHRLFNDRGEVSGLLLHDDALLDQDTLLVHFTSTASARAICSEGFAKGVPDVADIGLTVGHRAVGPGFNFAFVADDYPDYWSDAFSLDFASGMERDEDDGFAVVIFRTSAVHAYHWDDMWQAIFWGPEASTSRMLAFHVTETIDGRLALEQADGFAGSMKQALRHAEAVLPRLVERVRSELPWPDLAELYNADNPRSGLNPYAPLASRVEDLLERSGIEGMLASEGVIGERIVDPTRPNGVRWIAVNLPGMEIALGVDSGRNGVSLSLRPIGKGNLHADAQVYDLPMDMQPDRLERIVHRLAMRALPDAIETLPSPR